MEAAHIVKWKGQSGKVQTEPLQCQQHTHEAEAGMYYHITTQAAWDAAAAAGVYTAPSLETQGFIHLSHRHQVARVANAVYAGQRGLVLLAIEPARLRAEVRLEPPDMTIPAAHEVAELFPHLYGPLNTDAVAAVIEFSPDETGKFTFFS